ncbi:hypothetical protein CPC16_010168 [Podila verticillata]|nr:hypothetical protein BGZ52_006464 [Haplosporangium bisporale]KAF9380750.1 hypothetical protein CPC16_010168 [Podila verticillata]
MSTVYQYYYLHLVSIHGGLRKELKYCLQALTALIASSSSSPSTPPQPQQPLKVSSYDHLLTSSPLRTTLRNTLQFSLHLQRHHDIEEAVIFPEFAKVTDIAHWSHSHRELDATLARIRALARDGLMLDRIKTSYGGISSAKVPYDENKGKDKVDEEEEEDADDEEESTQERHEAKFLKKKAGRLAQELEALAKIVLPHLEDEEVMSTPDKTILWWPTESAMVAAFPWLLE